MDEASRGADHPTRTRRLERLSPLDVSNLRVEDHGLPMHVAALAILEGAPLVGGSGQLRLDELRDTLERRLDLTPRLRQVLVRPRFGLGPPFWLDDAGFDIHEHVRTRAVPAPGDEAALLEACAELNEPPLDRSRPLWEMWFLTGLADGTIALLIRLHHVVADGIAALALIGALFDADPSTRPPEGPLWAPRQAPTAGDLFADNVAQRAAAMSKAFGRLRRPALMSRHFGSLALQVRQLLRDGVAPRASFNRPIAGRRRLLLARADLGRVRAVAHAHGAKVNDVVLAAMAGGARRLLEARGELTPGLVIKVSVATSIRGPDDEAGGNRVGIIVVPLPVGERDPIRMLQAIARTTAERKRHPPYQPSARFSQRWMVRAMFHQRLVNLLESNLVGPATSFSLAGARVLEVFQVGVVQGNIPLCIAVLSYAGRLNFDIVADADAVPDLGVFAEGLCDALDQLEVELQSPISLGPEQPGEREDVRLDPDRYGEGK